MNLKESVFLSSRMIICDILGGKDNYNCGIVTIMFLNDKHLIRQTPEIKRKNGISSFPYYVVLKVFQ